MLQCVAWYDGLIITIVGKMYACTSPILNFRVRSWIRFIFMNRVRSRVRVKDRVKVGMVFRVMVQFLL